MSIGGIAIRMRNAEPGHLPAPLSSFLVDDATDAELTLDVLRGSIPEVDPAGLEFDSGGLWKLYRNGARTAIICTSSAFGPDPYKAAFIDPDFARGEIVIGTRATAGLIQPLDYPLDELLTSNLLGRGRGIELHACGLVDEGKAYAFIGQSGAGKTTTARLWLAERDPSSIEVLSDDRVIVRILEGTPILYGTPWHGEAEICSPASAPLAGLYLLQQAAETKLRRLSPTEASARLFTCSFPLFHSAESIRFTLAFLETLVELVPVFELRFRQDHELVDLVRSAA